MNQKLCFNCDMLEVAISNKYPPHVHNARDNVLSVCLIQPTYMIKNNTSQICSKINKHEKVNYL